MSALALGNAMVRPDAIAAASDEIALPRLRTPVLPPVDVSIDRVVRTTVGLRPYRPSGFVVRADRVDDQTVIHNYGHGGAGMSLAWGTGTMAADLALRHSHRRAAVIGCGSTGLTAARQLQRRGFTVTIYANTLPPYTTSNMSLASFTPASGLVDAERRTPAWDRQFRQAVDLSFRSLQQLIGQGYGVHWLDQYTAIDDLTAARTGNDGGLLRDVLHAATPGEVLEGDEHPFPTQYAVRTRSLSIEPSIYLDKLVDDFTKAGGRIVRRTFETSHELMSLAERIIVNCTGLGSLALFEDQELVPVKGQLSLLAPQPQVQYRVAARFPGSDGETINVSMHPRSDGIVIGNLVEPGSWSLEPDASVRDRNVAAAMQFFNAMRTRQS